MALSLHRIIFGLILTSGLSLVILKPKLELKGFCSRYKVNSANPCLRRAAGVDQMIIFATLTINIKCITHGISNQFYYMISWIVKFTSVLCIYCLEWSLFNVREHNIGGTPILLDLNRIALEMLNIYS